MEKNLTIKITKNNNALVSKEFAKKSAIYGTKEYDFWQEFKVSYPNAKKVIERKKVNDKLTYEKMQMYIDMEKSELSEIFERVKKLSKIQSSPYNYVLKWFKKYCSDYKESPIFVTEENENTNNELDVA